MVENTGKEISSEIPAVGQMIDQVIAEFKSKETIVNDYGKIEGYYLAEAVGNVIARLEQEGHNVFSISTKIFEETSIKPDELRDYVSTGQPDWKHFCEDLAGQILWLQTIKVHPELIEEENQRLEKYSYIP